MDITNDPSTWPTGDPIWEICHAIGYAEGADVAGSNPDRLNNPGDLSDGASQFGSEAHSGSSVTHFPDKHTGWQWLRNKIARHLDGKSFPYPPTLTIAQFAKIYAANWQNWKTNVGQCLGVDPDTTSFSDYVKSKTQ